jgi:RTX calcium-binding nonapeptide repeat (4 copies)
MSALRQPLRSRSLALSMTVVVAVAVTGLTAASPEVAAAATPKCLGKAATIVGTKRSEVIRGTTRADVIVAKGGNDTIVGRGGNDLICAGPGADVVRAGGGLDKVAGGAGADVLVGAMGPDVLRGNAGNDVLKGGDGDDAIDGGLGFDTCEQGAGSGTVSNCEKIEVPDGPVDPPDPPAPVATADLSVAVIAPKKATSGPLSFTVRVRNTGPDASGYILNLAYSSRRAVCMAPDWTGNHAGSALDPGKSLLDDVVIKCTKLRKGASVTVRASIAASIADPNPANDTASARTGLR